MTACGLLWLAACGASQVPVPSRQYATVAQFASSAQHARGRNLLYVAQDDGVRVYTFPGLKSIGSLGGFAGAEGLCSNDAGDVFVPFIDGYGGAYEFAHGGEDPIGYLSAPYGYARACAVDPKTANVAILNGYLGDGAYATVYHYKRHGGWRLGKSYEIPGVYSGANCGYDASSDLFCDGTSSQSGGFSLAELPANSDSFATVNVNQQITTPGQVQWDGTHLAIGDEGISPSVIYRFTINGSSLTAVAETTLNGSVHVEQFWIRGNRVVAPDYARECQGSVRGCIAVYPYPGGGSALATLSVFEAQGTTISIAR